MSDLSRAQLYEKTFLSRENDFAGQNIRNRKARATSTTLKLVQRLLFARGGASPLFSHASPSLIGLLALTDANVAAVIKSTSASEEKTPT